MSEFSGTLTQRVRIFRQSDVRDLTGASAAEWIYQSECFAAVRHQGSGKSAEGASLSALPRFQLTVRSSQTVDVGYQIRWKDRAMIVLQKLEDPAQPDRLSLLCEELR